MVRQSCVDVVSGGSNYILQRGLSQVEQWRGAERLEGVAGVKVKVPQGAT